MRKLLANFNFRLAGRLRGLAVPLAVLATAGAAMAQDNVDLFPVECRVDFVNLFIQNEFARANVEFLVDLYQTRGGDSEIAGAFDTAVSRQAAAVRLASVAQDLDAAYLTYGACLEEHDAMPMVYPMSREELARAMAGVGEALLASPFDAEALLTALVPLAGWDPTTHGCLLANVDRINQVLNAVAGEENMPLDVPGRSSCR